MPGRRHTNDSVPLVPPPAPDSVWVLRIPKTGSGTLVRACGPLTRTMLSHSESLSDVVTRSGGNPGVIVASVRHPVDRFRSAFDMYNRQGEMESHGFRRVEDFVAAGPGEWNQPYWGSAFWRQTYWLQSPEVVRRYGVNVFHTPQMSEQLRVLKTHGWRLLDPDSHGNRHDAGASRSLFTDSTGAVREWYADDLRLLEGLGYE